MMTTGVMADTSLARKMLKAKTNNSLVERTAVPGAFNSMKDKLDASFSFYSTANVDNKRMSLLKAARAEEANPFEGMIPVVSPICYLYDDIYQGFLQYNMFVAYFGVNGTAAKLSLFQTDAIDGVVESGPNMLTPYAEDGEVIDSITFDLQKPVYVDEETGTKYILDLIDPNSENLTRLNATTMGGYYFPADSTLAFTSDVIVGLFPEDKTVNEPVGGLLVTYMQYYPLDTVFSQLLKGTYTGTTYDGEPLSGDVQVFADTDYDYDDEGNSIPYYCFYINNFDLYEPTAWMRVDQSTDGLTASLARFQYILTANFEDENVEDGMPYTLCTYSFQKMTEQGAYPSANGACNFFTSVDENENIIMENDGEGQYTEIGWPLEGDFELFGFIYDLTFTLTAEKVDAAVKGISNTTAKPVGVEYYDLQGRRVNRHQKGALVMKTRLSDGTVTSYKFVRK